ncbi:MAG: DUF188 domain-containing protein [Clostridia bacterium]|nr:DUF188 domain-containing protein [Clostridia bacterium]
MKILIDADGCPVTDITVREGAERNIGVTIFSDTSHIFRRTDAECVTVDKGADSADFVIANRANAGDVVVTQDYGLASMCLAKGAYVIRQDGLLYTAENIDFLLADRYEAKKAIRSGKRIKGPKKRMTEDDEAYKRALCNLLDRL